VEDGRLKLRFPEPERARLEPVIQILRQNREAALEAVATSEAIPPPIESWPESLLDLTQERAAQIGDTQAAREEIWISWCEWKARELNRLLQEHGLTGQPGRIRPETIRNGVERAPRVGRAADKRRTPGESGEL
jgi:hypothetical protein